MLNRLIQFALTQRLLMLLVVALLAAGGWYAFSNLPIDAFPDVSTTQVKVIVKAPGMTPGEVESRITSRIEVEMLGIPNQTMLRSTSKYALADITIDFAGGTDIYWARQQVAERLGGIWGDLPADISGGMAPMTTPLGEMLMFTLDGPQSLRERRSLLDWVIRPALRTVPGVADVNSLGGRVRTFEVVPDEASLYAQGLTMQQLAATLMANNRNDGAGRLTDGEETMLVRSQGSITGLDDLADIVVKPNPVEPVRLDDVADVHIGSLTRYGAVTHDGLGETVEGLVLGLRGANARSVVEGVKNKLAALLPALPANLKTNIFYDRGSLVDNAVETVSGALQEAIILVLILLVVFLANLRAALTVALILPLAALSTFILMRWFGLSANLMSLGGLAIAIGMLVDAAVVVVENVVSHLSRQDAALEKLPRLHLIYRAVSEVSVPVASGILIIIIVFLPLLTLQGLEGKLFTPVAVTIVFALASSLILSLTVIPVLASFLLGRVSHTEPWLVRQLERAYIPTLRWCLGHGRIVAGVAALLLVIAGLGYFMLGKSFMPTMDEGSLIVQLEKLPSISLEESLRTDTMVQKALLREVPEITHIVARTGSDELGLDPMGLNQTDTFLELKPRDQWRMPDKAGLIDAIRGVLDRFSGFSYSFTQPIQMRVSEMLTGVRGDLAIKIFGNDMDSLNRTADAIVAAVSKVPGAEDVYTPRNEGVQYLQVNLDRVAIGRVGLSVDDIENVLRTYLEGRQIGTVYEGARRTALVIRGKPGLRASPPQFENLMITLDDGRSVPLGSLATLQRTDGPVAINRELGTRMTVVIANVTGRDLVSFVEDAKQAVAKQVKLPPGSYLAWGGQFENQQRAARRLGMVVPVALGLIFLLLFTTFRSVPQSLLILANIPFALVGGVVGLWLTGEYLSVPASVGFIALLGIAVLNGVVMVTYFNQLRNHGMPLDQVVVEGARRRLRPVMMTASIAAFGLVPLLFATGPGSEIQRPLAVVVIGGLVTSTALTLILLPMLYRRFGGN